MSLGPKLGEHSKKNSSRNAVPITCRTIEIKPSAQD
jgi:hypothetical protein